MTEERPETPRPYEDEIDLIDYLEVIVRRRWLIILGMVLFAVGAVGYERFLAPSAEFEAEANLLLLDNREVDTTGAIVKKTVNLGVLQSYPALSYVLDQPALSSNGDSVTVRQVLDPDSTSTVHGLMQAVSGMVEGTTDESGVISITVTNANPRLAASIANAHMGALVKYYSDIQREQVQRTLSFIQSRLLELESGLRAAEDSLYTLRTRYQEVSDEPAELRRVSRETSWIQQTVEARTEVYRRLLNQREQVRIRSEREGPKFEVLNYATAEDSRKTGLSVRERAGLAAGAGLVLSLLLAFLLEFVSRNRKSGRLEPVLAELRKDPVFGWIFGQGGRGAEEQGS